MTVIDAYAVIQALGLPDSCRVEQRVPKKLLLENGVPTASDKRLITDAIEEIQWFAALKPNTIGVPDYRDSQREYLEIAVLVVTLRGTVKPASCSRLAELVHRAVPYPVLLLLVEGQTVALSLAHKRWAQNEASKVVLDGSLTSTLLFHATADATATDAAARSEAEHAFVQSLSIAHQPKTSLHALYQGWMDCVQALQAAQWTGNYRTTATPEQAVARRQALADCERLEAEISRLRAQGTKERQMARQVEINLQLKALLAERQRIAQYL
ncbi:DUF4391 domain-containing protein [Alcaligenes sp. NLF5-7]|uniref:DUF4391 domain-containing protein n=1 Tax=Alcaligenes sp. NLF5-7 TaxID=2918755 RepID=UPI0020C29C33|nr:DUF4391 domain-containing protein [Alcaligenes sp. NLF5-7]UTM01312.1 DUF4391 domain-containing protein [Alcaligenes sp. NLF5-7]